MDRFDRVFWNRVWRLAKPYWVSKERRRGITLLVVIIVLSGVSIGLQAVFSYVNRDLVNALQTYNLARFHRMILLFALYILFAIVSFPFNQYLIGRLSILWRKWMTQWFLGLGFTHHAFYRIDVAGEIDNPDQRIQEDLDNFTSGALTYALSVLTSLATGMTFFVILWSISPMLALALITYAIAGTYGAVVVGRRLVTINYNQQRYEADFRFGLVHVRDNIESISMYGGESHEIGQLMRRFASVFDNFHLLLRWQLYLGFFTTGYDNALNLMPWVLLAGAYFAHHFELGVFTQAAYAFGLVQGSLSLVVDQFQGLAGYATVVQRLAIFAEACELPPQDGEQIEIVPSERFAVQALVLKTPDDGKTLVRELSLELPDRARLLISGESGAGKTSLLRAIAGLWRNGSGRIERPDLADIMFLPQRPYIILGSLRDQLCYPRAAGASDQDLRAILARVNLADLPERVGGLDADRNWTDLLSPGEQQRLAFARLMLNRPRLAFLDEATSALDPANEQRLYRGLDALPTEIISIGHRTSLSEYHDYNLELRGGGEWNLREIAGGGARRVTGSV